MKFSTQAHVTYKTRYHVIWIPKYRRKVLVSGVKEYFQKVMDTRISERYPDVHVLERNVLEDHLHVLLEIPPKYSVSKIIGDIKAYSSKEMRKNFDCLKQQDELVKRNPWSFICLMRVNR